MRSRFGLLCARAVAAAGAALADSLLAGTAVAAGEVARLFLRREISWSATDAVSLVWVVLGLCAVAAAVAGPALLGLVGGLRRSRALRGWRTDLVAGGGARVAALAGALLVLSSAAAFGLLVFRVARWTHGAFHEPVPIAVLEATILAGGALAIALACAELERRISPAAAAWRPAARWTSGRRGAAVVAVAIAAAAIGGPLMLGAVVPTGELERPVAALHFTLALIALRSLRLGAGRRRRLIRIAALPAAVAAATVPVALGAADAARAAVAAQGAATRPIIALVWRAFDRDGDGFASGSVGGADCDDGDPAAGPTASEIIGNGRDENCNGRDLSLDQLSHRVTARPTSTPGAPRHNVLLVTIDSVRADHLGAWGYRRPTSPALDALAGRSTRFAWAFTSAPSTRWAISTMSYGRYPSSFGWTRGGKTVKLGKAPSLPKVFAEGGYETHGVMCCSRFFGKASGPLAGLGKIDDSANTAYKKERPERYNGDLVAKKVVRFLEDRRPDSRPFFLWAHFIDPHHPYHRLPGTPDFGDRGVDRYDSEIAFVDRQIGAILETLRRTGLADRTIVAVASDHGDEFKEHGHNFHSKNLYNQVLRVPLVIHYPGAAPRVESTPVSLVDLGPTLVDLIGLEGPAGQNGRSLAAAVRGTGPAPARPILSELIPGEGVERNLIAIASGCHKLIWDRQANTYELFSICDDPADLSDLAPADPATLARMRALLRDQGDIELTPLPSDRPAPGRGKVQR